MKKKFYLRTGLVLALCLALTACGNDPADSGDTGQETQGQEEEMDEEEKAEIEEYEKRIAKFTPITMDDLAEKKDQGDEFLVYAGFSKCPFCRELSPYLVEYVENSDLDVYYLNSKEEADQFNEFAKKNKISYVPSFFYFKDGEMKATDDIETPYNLENLEKALDSIIQ